jgi:hypothetical protein
MMLMRRLLTDRTLVAITEDGQREITLADVDDQDPDTPENQRTLIVKPGANYTLQGNIVIPLPNFFGDVNCPCGG